MRISDGSSDVCSSDLDHCTRCPEWMAHGNRAAIDVDLVVRNLHVTHIAKHDARKSFVQFEEVNVLFCHACDLQGFLATCGRRGQPDRRPRTDVGTSAKDRKRKPLNPSP